MIAPLKPLLATALLALAGTIPSPAQAAPEGCGMVPATMRAARIAAAGPPQALTIETVPVARPAAGEVLVQVHYAAVNPVDWKLQQAGRLPFPATPGGDFAGVVVALGAGVTGFACGDAVAGIVDQVARPGSYAEYVAVPVTEIVPAPPALTMAEAAGLPTVAVAAWRYLVEAAGVQAGERVLVHGGAGGVGSLAVQVAKARGAHVIATASARNHDFLRELGADQTIDYRTTRFQEAVRDVDIVIDTVGGDTLARSPAVLRDGGRLVTLVGTVPAHLCADGRIACPATPPWRVRPALEAVAPLVASGQVRIHVERVYPLDQVVDAQEHSRSGRTRGKVVIAMPVAQDPSAQDGLARDGDPTAARPRP